MRQKRYDWSALSSVVRCHLHRLDCNRLDPWAHLVPTIDAMSKSPPPLAAKEFFTAEFLNDPYPTYRRQLENHGLQFIEIHGGIWAVFKYADCASLIRDPRLYAKRTGTLIDQFPPERRGELAELEHMFSLWMLFFDAPEHTRLRKRMNQGFTPAVAGPWGGGP